MSKREGRDEPDQNRGPNLWLIYGLILLGLLIAFGLAALVVWPFYQHRH